jgi:hypothetical protein
LQDVDVDGEIKLVIKIIVKGTSLLYEYDVSGVGFNLILKESII